MPAARKRGRARVGYAGCALALALALAACTERAYPPAVRVPDAEPAGAAYGRLLDGDGMSVPGGRVRMSQPYDSDFLTTAFAVVSLGLLCLFPGVCSAAEFSAKLSDDGLWQIGPENIEPEKPLTFTGQAPRTQSGGGASTSVTVAQGAVPQRVPDIVLWQPALDLADTAGGVLLSWPELDGVPRGEQVRYEARVVTPGLRLSPTTDQATRTARISRWQLEDPATALHITALTRRGEAAYSYLAPALLPDDAPVPPSRDRACLAQRGPELVAVAGSCSLTDGDLDDREELTLPGDCDRSEPECVIPDHPRICIDLGERRRVRAVVIRESGIFADESRVELSRDGLTFTSIGRLSDEDFIVTRAPRGATARYACLSHPEGLSGWEFGEVSVW